MSLFELACRVQTLERRVASLSAEVRHLRGRASDDQGELVEATHAAFGDHIFSSAELLARALRADGPGSRLAALLAGRTVRGVGRLLAAAAGRVTPGGLVLRSAGSVRAGTVWCIRTPG